jgi:hypothetical protein
MARADDRAAFATLCRMTPARCEGDDGGSMGGNGGIGAAAPTPILLALFLVLLLISFDMISLTR